MNGYLYIANVLIQANANLNIQENTGCTALMLGIIILIHFN